MRCVALRCVVVIEAVGLASRAPRGFGLFLCVFGDSFGCIIVTQETWQDFSEALPPNSYNRHAYHIHKLNRRVRPLCFSDETKRKKLQTRDRKSATAAAAAAAAAIIK